MNRRSLYAGLGSLAIAVLAALVVLVATQAPSEAQVGAKSSVNQYASKFLCGVIPSPASPAQVLAPGVYNTAVNIHNSNDFDVVLQKKAVLSLPESGTPNQGLPGLRRTEILRPDASMEVDCTEINALLASANPPCVSALPGALPFCKGYMVTEAAQIINTPQGPKAVPAQIDVTDIITIKEEDGIWKDYTFKLQCLAPCQPIVDVNTGVVYQYGSPYNWPDRPVKPPCYNDQALQCDTYDVDNLIRTRLSVACGCPIPPAPNVTVILIDDDFATDSRDVTLDYEFVSPKPVVYPQWPVQVTGCDLGITKVGAPGVPAAGTITYTITVTCAPNGPGSVGNVFVQDSWPPIVIFAGPTPSQGTCGPPTANPFLCNLGPMAAGSSATITFSVDSGGPVTVSDTATVDPLNIIIEPNELNNTVTISNFVP
ncbi:MAG: DUF11 domain-containing protein [Dehalococcoidia bacterium]|nr:DUF11 domain-containing protein [Dehalococcoidia bacterium]